MSQKKVNEMRSSTRILVGLVIGTVAGLVLNKLHFQDSRVLNAIVTQFLDPFGAMFMRCLRIIVVPLVFASLITGVGRMGSVQKLGSMGTKLGAYYLITSLIAVVIGQILVVTIQPGTGLDPSLVESAKVQYSEQISALSEKSQGVGQSLWPGILVTIVPNNIIEAMAETNMLAIIFFAIVFGSALLALNKSQSEPVLAVTNAIEDAVVVMVGWIMRFAPYAVAALMVGVTARFGSELLENLAKYVFVVVLGYLVHFFGTYGIFVRVFLKYPVSTFMKKMAPVYATAFSTSSSAATMPTTIHTAEKSFGVKKELASFSIPLGTTVNMDGTALFECVAALFVAQIFGVEIGLGGQISLVLIIVLSSIGVAGVPGGSIPIVMSAMAMFGINPVGIALVLGVDRLLDMGRTVLNVTGDMCGALYLAKCDGQELNTTLEHEEESIQN